MVVSNMDPQYVHYGATPTIVLATYFSRITSIDGVGFESLAPCLNLCNTSKCTDHISMSRALFQEGFVLESDVFENAYYDMSNERC